MDKMNCPVEQGDTHECPVCGDTAEDLAIKGGCDTPIYGERKKNPITEDTVPAPAACDARDLACAWRL